MEKNSTAAAKEEDDDEEEEGYHNSAGLFYNNNDDDGEFEASKADRYFANSKKRKPPRNRSTKKVTRKPNVSMKA